MSSLTALLHSRPHKLIQGLFKPDGTAVHPEGMNVVVHNLNATVKNRLRTPCLVIIEFTLGELPDTGSPGQLLNLSLAPNYGPNRQDLHYKQILFDIKDDAAFTTHINAVSDVVKKLERL